MTLAYEFFVEGTPVSQGSKSAAIGRDGRVHVYEKLGKRLKVWRNDITIIAKGERRGRPALQGALGVSLMFHVKHPVRGDRRAFPVGVPDLDKLVRAVLDALTDAGIWVDDSQAVEIHAAKRYAARPKGKTGVFIAIGQLSESRGEEGEGEGEQAPGDEVATPSEDQRDDEHDRRDDEQDDAPAGDLHASTVPAGGRAEPSDG